jgi:hypothetical protein
LFEAGREDKVSQTADRQKIPMDPGAEPADAGTRWQDLRHGDAVIVEPVEGHSLPGWVDTVAEDSSVLWIQLGEGLGRRLIHCQDGISVRPRLRA